MKKILCILLALLLILWVTACKKREEPKPLKDEPVVGVLVDGTYEGAAGGFSGLIIVGLVIENGAFKEVNLLSETEGKAIGSSAVLNVIQQINDTNNLSPVDIVAGATQSSYGTLDAINAAYQRSGALYKPYDSKSLSPAPSTLKLGTSYIYDVVVVGGGGAGLTAAIAAAEEGATVAVLERNSFLGGTTLLSGGVINNPSKSESFVEDIKSSGGESVNANLAETFANATPSTIEWLQEMGVSGSKPKQAKGHSEARTITLDAGGAGLINSLKAEAEALGVDIYLNSHAQSLTFAENRISGVIAIPTNQSLTGSAFLEARKGVVLATGGFSSNSTYRKENLDKLPVPTTITTSGYDIGSGLSLTEPFDPMTVNLNQVQITPYSSLRAKQTSPFMGVLKHGGVLVSEYGYIFPTDTLTETELIELLTQDYYGESYLIWDETALEKAGLKEVSTEPFVQSGELFVGNDLGEIAEKLNVRSFELKSYADEVGYNPTGPLTGQELSIALTGTLGGLGVNDNAQVLAASGAPISGLYAAGEVVGGLHGEHALEGNMLTSALVLGRLAGQSAAA